MNTISTASVPSDATAAHHIVVAEDDAVIADTLNEALVEAGFRVTVARDGASLKSVLASQPVSLITLDLGLPDADGIDLARDVTARYDVPIIMVTGKTKKISKIIGLEVGADDYIVKPFDLDELIARIRAVLRRSRRAGVTQGGTAGSVGADGTAVRFEGWNFDVIGHRLTTPSGELVDLTSSELELLAIFVQEPRAPLSRAVIAERLRNQGDMSAERSIDVLVGRLRRKLEKYAAGQDLIKTVRGEGYLFSPEVQSATQKG